MFFKKKVSRVTFLEKSGDLSVLRVTFLEKSGDLSVIPILLRSVRSFPQR